MQVVGEKSLNSSAGDHCYGGTGREPCAGKG
jgi:hypothetical protein